MTTFGKKPPNSGFGKRKVGRTAVPIRGNKRAQDALSAEAKAFLDLERNRQEKPAYAGEVMTGEAGIIGGKPVFGRRFIAFLIDTLLISLPFFIIMFSTLWAEIDANASLALTNPEQYKLQVQLMVIKWGLMHGMVRAIYAILMENWKGATVGKMLMGIVVANNDGGKPSLLSIILRNTIGRVMTNIIPVYIGYWIALSNEKRKCIHDMIAGSTVRKKVAQSQDVSAIFA